MRQKVSSTAVVDLLFADESVILGLVDELGGCLNRAKMESLADELLRGVVPGKGSVAVTNSMVLRPDSTDMEYLKAVLVVWLKKVARANVILC